MRTSLLSLPLLLKMSGGMRIFGLVVIIIIILVTILYRVHVCSRRESFTRRAMSPQPTFDHIVKTLLWQNIPL
jgi:hypothetical protein